MTLTNPAYDRFGVTVHAGDWLDLAASLPDNSVHAVITDPPYALPGGFMGKAWDTFSSGHAYQDWCQAWATECLRVLTPGGNLLALGGARTAHRLTTGIEDAGFELRDAMAWIYAGGFPKNHDVSRAIDRTVGADREVIGTTSAGESSLHRVSRVDQGYRANLTACTPPDCTDRCDPACPVAELDAQSGLSASRPGPQREATGGDGWRMTATGTEYTDAGGASRFFPAFRFEAKAPRAERPRVNGISHPTVKPLALMRWLVRLVTPPAGIVLDPFLGSGTTAQAARAEGFRCIGFEREADYLPLIRARLDAHPDDQVPAGEPPEPNLLDLLDGEAS